MKIKLAKLNPGDVFKKGKHKYVVLDQIDPLTRVFILESLKKGVPFDKVFNRTGDYAISELRKIFQSEEIINQIKNDFNIDDIPDQDIILECLNGDKKDYIIQDKVAPIGITEYRKNYEIIPHYNDDNYWTTTRKTAHDNSCVACITGEYISVGMCTCDHLADIRVVFNISGEILVDVE